MTRPSPVSQSLRAWMDVFMHRSMRNWHNFAKSAGLSMPQFSILMQLRHKGACRVSEIGERFDITNAAASQLVDKLVQSGHLARAEDPQTAALHEWVACMLAERLADNNFTIEALLD
ncbi:MAG: MarR family winged helix-turn-helix transcriptional regulator [Chloroflexota bacterium]